MCPSFVSVASSREKANPPCARTETESTTSMTFIAVLAGIEISSVLWVLALIVARFYGDFGRWDGWVELRLDLTDFGRLARGRQSSTSLLFVELLGVGAMLGWFAALGFFVLYS